MDINYEIMDSNDKLLLNMMNYNLSSSYKGNMHSHHYLKFSDKSITEISSICGFNNTTSFYNAFKKFDGMPPSIYRKK
jgi:AraC-like DNA-binding protein